MPEVTLDARASEPTGVRELPATHDANARRRARAGLIPCRQRAAVLDATTSACRQKPLAWPVGDRRGWMLGGHGTVAPETQRTRASRQERRQWPGRGVPERDSGSRLSARRAHFNDKARRSDAARPRCGVAGRDASLLLRPGRLQGRPARLGPAHPAPSHPACGRHFGEPATIRGERART